MDAISYRYPDTDTAVSIFRQMNATAEQVVRELPKHRLLLDRIKEYGLSEI
eukprot:GDKH01026969.1.p1 GENE.GDKH01026969.1~~GDKH01026969.1.p1  ORF type:complete len:51 (+),score=11.92 GDKH01026969.1:3-155(+)